MQCRFLVLLSTIHFINKKMQHYGRVWAVAAVVLVNAAFSEAAIDNVWNVPGARGTIDFRYPDYIMEPKVECPYEGVFPHPWNCTWYYRCYRDGSGLYWVAYFKCEEGTVFSDSLDQCVFESANEKCLPIAAVTCPVHVEGCSPRRVCPEHRRSKHKNSTEVCAVAEKRCSDGRKLPLCPSTHIYEKETKTCILKTCKSNKPVEQTSDKPVTCNEIRSDDCKFEAFCPGSYHQSQFIGTVNVCRIADVWCSNGTKSHQVCNDNELYEPATKSCRLSSAICPRPKARPQLPFLCTNVVENCRESFSCASFRQSTASHRYCDMHRVCSQTTTAGLKTISKTNVCPNGGVFDVNSNRCIETPKDVTACVKPKTKDLTCKIITETCYENTICQNSMKVLMCHHLFECGDHLKSTFQSTNQGVGCVSIDEVEITCNEIRSDDCKFEAFCPGPYHQSQFIGTVNVCRIADVWCSNGTKSHQVCKDNELYDPVTKSCKIASGICPRPKGRPHLPILCTNVVENCRESFPCASFRQSSHRHCDVFELCTEGGKQLSKTNVCPDSQVFDVNSNTCIEKPRTDPQPGSTDACLKPKDLTCTMKTETCYESTVNQNSKGILVCHQLFDCGDHVESTFQSAKKGSNSIAIEGVDPKCETKLSGCSYGIRCPENFSKSNYMSREKTCSVAQAVCTGRKTINLCTKGNVYHVALNDCVPERSFCTPGRDPEISGFVCTDEFTSCWEKQICPDPTTNIPETVRRCDMRTVCRESNSIKSNETYCKDEKKFDAFSNACVNAAEDRKCPNHVSHTGETVSQCKVYTEKCQKKPICNSSDLGYKCVQLFSCRDKSSREATLDLHGGDRKRCLERLTKKVVINLSCRYAGQIPKSETFKRMFCKRNAMCGMENGRQKFRGVRHLCTKFYRCELSDTGFHAVLSSCPSNQILNYEKEKCINLAGDSFICGSRKKSSHDKVSNSIVLVEESLRADGRVFDQEATTTLSLKCSRLNQIPESEEIRKHNCRRRKICDIIGNTVETELCDKFYVCRFKGDGNKYSLDVRTCKNGLMFSYEERACVKSDECKTSSYKLLR